MRGRSRDMVEKKGPQEQGTWLKVFCPNARCLGEEEILDLPAEKRRAAESSGKEGLWLEVFCPDESCLTDEEKTSIPILTEATEKSKRGLWLNLFCPEDRCEITRGSDLP